MSITCLFLFTGCMDSGVGHEQLNKLLSVMSLPPLYRNTIIRAQECVGQSLASVARNSCKEAIQLEKSLTEDSTRARRYVGDFQGIYPCLLVLVFPGFSQV